MLVQSTPVQVNKPKSSQGVETAEPSVHSTPPCKKKRKRRLSPSKKDSHETDDTDNPQSEGGGFDLDNFEITDWADPTLDGDPPGEVDMEEND